LGSIAMEFAAFPPSTRSPRIDADLIDLLPTAARLTDRPLTPQTTTTRDLPHP
jgi:hypothetical protein